MADFRRFPDPVSYTHLKVQKKLDLARVDFKEALGAPEVIRKFLPTSVRKLLVFLSLIHIYCERIAVQNIKRCEIKPENQTINIF